MKPIEINEDVVRKRPKLIRRMRWVMFLGLIGGPVVFAIGLFQFLEVRSLAQEGLTVAADVHDSSVLNTGKGRRVYKITADYRPPGLPVHRKEFTVREAEYETAKASGKTNVTFLPSKPTVSTIGSQVRPEPETMVIGGGVFLVALLIWLYFKKKAAEIRKAIFRDAPTSATQPE